MGQQQLLLIILGVIIIGIAILMGIILYRANAIENKKDSLISDCAGIGTMAQKYYWTPRSMGGGNNSFQGFAIPKDFRPTANGNYKITNIQKTEIEITATGNEVVVDTDSVLVIVKILPKTFKITKTVP